MGDEALPRSLADWRAVAPAERARLRAVVAQVARGSAHGDWIAVADADAEPGAGVLAGIPFSVKDNIDVAGFATTAGSPLLGDEPVAVDAGAVGALRNAGAVVAGKTNLHELAFGITGENAAFGPVRNPADPSRSAGGSSSGSAVGVALGVVPFGLGTDTGGSITVPASFCGVVGFRPSTGRYPGDGVVNLSTSRDTIGVHAHTVRDVRTVDEVLTRDLADRTPPAAVAGLRIGLPRDRFADLDPEVARVVDDAVAALDRAGAHLVEVDLEPPGLAGVAIVFYEGLRLLAGRVDGPPADWPGRVASPDVRALIASMVGSPATVEAYEGARRARWAVRDAYADLFREVDVLLAPTSPVPPPPLGRGDGIELNGRRVPTFATVVRNTDPGTVAGVPMISLPAGRTRDGLPVGVCLEARAFGDSSLLHVAEAVEAVLAAR
ncbi:amidase family protein [Actinosynnema sp. NPDC020468]|uniref:amidase family protein n=1 Tax=Actinosynnema sp. NPDC020468 TaxID=3154488 RepID=UPI0033C607F7